MRPTRPATLAVVTAAMIGIALGIGAFTFVYARGGSYLTNDPAACVNCHVMREQYDGWMASSHRDVAACNDCHTEHSLVRKYLTKALNGFNHSLAFTTGWFHEPIEIGARNRSITEGACRHCHAALTRAIEGDPPVAPIACLRCHESVGHLH